MKKLLTAGLADRHGVQPPKATRFSTRSKSAAPADGTTSPWTTVNRRALRLARRHRGSGGPNAGKVVGQITQLARRARHRRRARLNKGFITNGQSNSVTIFDLKTLAKTGEPATGPEPRRHLLRAQDAAHLHHSTAAPTIPPPSTPRPTRSWPPSRWARSRKLRRWMAPASSTSTSKNSSEVVEIDAAKPAVTRRVVAGPREGPSGPGHRRQEQEALLRVRQQDDGRHRHRHHEGDRHAGHRHRPDAAGFDSGLAWRSAPTATAP
jgi:hypothetical protein